MKLFVIMAVLALLAGRPVEARAQNAAESGGAVRLALEEWMRQYPESQYADVYKNFFQDRFGPGHLLADKGAALKYLEAELADEAPFDGPMLEPTGADGRFVRVNLSVIRDSLVSTRDFFSAFVKSMEGLTLPSGNEWRAEWAAIDSVITVMGLRFPDEEADRAIVAKAMLSGDFAVHHSDRYNAAYSRHYRIIRADIVTRHLLPSLPLPADSPAPRAISTTASANLPE